MYECALCAAAVNLRAYLPAFLEISSHVRVLSICTWLCPLASAGFDDRLEAELKGLLAADVSQAAADTCRVVGPGNRRFTAWLGGSVLSGLPEFEESLIWRDEYMECGSDLSGDTSD